MYDSLNAQTVGKNYAFRMRIIGLLGAWLLTGFVNGFSQPSWLAGRRSRSFGVSSNIESIATSGSVAFPVEDVEGTLSSHPFIGRLIFLLPADDTLVSKFGSASPVGCPLLCDAARHLAQKANYYADGQLEWEIISLSEIPTLVDASGNSNISDKSNLTLSERLCQAEVLIAIGLSSVDEIEYTKAIFDSRRQTKPHHRRNRLCHFALDCATQEDLPALVGPYDSMEPSSLKATLLPWTIDATGKRLHAQMLDLFTRWTSDDFCYALMLFLNQFSGRPVDWVRYRTDATWEKGIIQNAREFYSMIDQCGDCIMPCLQDDNCRECLTKLTQIDPRDQANSYRTLVSYESDLLTKFSLCIFTKKNVFQCDATIPKLPQVEPIASWRGNPITEEVARSLLVGHLAHMAAPEGSLGLEVSWKVACGANVAYDQFPCQNQVFYPAIRGSDMWYDPVFRVETLDGRNVWCKRHYKVRPCPIPGTFRFSVSDNGVTSDEFWTIVGAADDLSWIVFHYAGAAKAVGLRYLGGLLCTADGTMPSERELPAIWDCFARSGIQPWELYLVDNSMTSPGAIDAGPPPLDFYRSQVMMRQARAISPDKSDPVPISM